MMSSALVRRALAGTVAVFLLLAWLAPSPAAAQTVNIKVGTLVPTNSSWFLILKEVADKWAKISNGRVKLTLFGGGVKGDDPEVVRAMRINELQGGVLISVGLAEIDKAVYALSIPMAYDSYDEVYAVLEKLRPRLEQSFDAKGFVVLNWADGGFSHFFTKKPVATPDDLRKLKLFQWAGDPKSLEIWKAAGFNPLPAPSSELTTGLTTGLYEACSLSPQIAQVGRYFEKAKYMTDLNWALVLGGTVITKEAWAKVPADIKPALMQAMTDAGAKLRTDVHQSEQKDVTAMKSAGLTVVPVDAKNKELWRKTAEAAYPKVRGDFVPADAFDEAMRIRDDLRKAPAAKK